MERGDAEKVGADAASQVTPYLRIPASQSMRRTCRSTFAAGMALAVQASLQNDRNQFTRADQHDGS